MVSTVWSYQSTKILSDVKDYQILYPNSLTHALLQNRARVSNPYILVSNSPTLFIPTLRHLVSRQSLQEILVCGLTSQAPSLRHE